MFIAEIEQETSLFRTNYIGCYKDSIPRDFSYVFGFKSMTIELCSRFCLSFGDRYFGIENGLDSNIFAIKIN